MEILQLKYFCDSAENENFSKTAKKYIVPTSAVSQSIKRLEKELDTTLFIRKTNKIILNEQGKLFYQQVKKALLILEDAKKEVIDDGETGNIKISFFANRSLVMNTLERFNKKYPKVNLISKYSVSPDIEDFDVIIADDEYTNTKYSYHELMEEDILVAIHKDNPLSTKDFISAEDLKQQYFICSISNGSLYQITQKICRNLGFTPNVVIQSDDPHFMRKCIELNLGIAFFPAKSWKGKFSNNVLIKDICGFKRKTYAYYNKKQYLSKCVKNFLKMLTEEFSKQ